jgi:hypothetical protein
MLDSVEIWRGTDVVRVTANVVYMNVLLQVSIEGTGYDPESVAAVSVRAGKFWQVPYPALVELLDHYRKALSDQEATA